jgi:hypothetical protein
MYFYALSQGWGVVVACYMSAFAPTALAQIRVVKAKLDKFFQLLGLTELQPFL